MKRIALLLLPVVAACASTSGGGADTGAASPTQAIQQFLAAAQRKDLTALANVWGTKAGPASRDKSLKDRLERSEFIMIACLPHEKAVLGASSPGEGGSLRIPVELTLVNLKATATFVSVQGPKGRWYVESFEMDKLRDNGFCGATPTKPASPAGSAG